MVVINNHFERAVALLASQFQFNKPDGSLTNFQKLLQAIIVPAQQLEDVNYELLTERWLATAIGQQLDEIGIILGLPRELNESDADYRERLQFQIFINTSSGTPEQAIAVLKFLTKATEIVYYEATPAFYQMETNGLVFPNPPNDLNDAIKQISPAGVNYVPIIATYNVPISFELSGDLEFNPLGINANLDDPTEINLLQVDPYAKILYVNAGNVEQNGIEGGLEELNFPLPTAGQLSELIQKNGNFPAER